jgi:hypothetical protein
MISNLAFHTRGASDAIDPTDKDKEILRMTVALEQSRVARVRKQEMLLRAETEGPVVEGGEDGDAFVYRATGRQFSEFSQGKEEEDDSEEEGADSRAGWLSQSLGDSLLQGDASHSLLLPKTKMGKTQRKKQGHQSSVSIQVGNADEEAPTQAQEERYREYVESMRVPKSKWKSATQEAKILQSFHLSNSEVISTDIQVHE